MLRGTIRDQVSHQRHTPLPEAVATGAEPLLVVGAMAGG
jgi:hypothetical protein